MSIYKSSSLAMIPTAYKDGKLYSVRPTDGDGDFTFSRGSNLAATRVDVNGLIEKGRENLLLQSNQFNTTWTASNASVTSGQSGYDGSSDAWELDVTTAAGKLEQSFTSKSGINTISLYAKEGTLDFLMIYARDAGGSNDAEFYFNLGSGVVGSTKGSAAITLKITDVGGGWYRCEGASSGGFDQYRIYGSNVDNSVAGTGTIYIQDAQLEQGLVATDYIETGTSAAQSGILEDMPRLDYSGGASCPALLLEPQRSNLVEFSEYYGSYWNINDVTIISNDSISPEGIQNATKISETATTARHRLGAGTITIPSAGIYVASVFMKKGTARYGFVHFSGTASYTLIVDLEEGIITDTATNGTIAYQNIEDYGNGWYRCSVGGNSNPATTSYLVQFGIAGAAIPPTYNNYVPQYAGSTSNYLYAYGAQLESGSYPTSYIPTYGTAGSRGEDKSWLLNTNVMPTDYPFTMFVEAPVQAGKDEDFISFGRSDTSDSYKCIQFKSSTNKVQVQNRVGASNTILTSSSTYSTGTLKIAYKLTSSEVKVFVNGVEEASSSSVTAFDSVDDLLLGQLRIVSDTNRRSTLKQALIFPTALTDSECIALTS